MNTITLGQLETLTSTRVLNHLDREATIPVVTRAACQGDVSVLRVTTAAAATLLSRAGVAVVRGEAGGNTHSLHADGAGVCWDLSDGGDGELVLGTLTVPDGATAFLLHPEHGGMAIAPGTYRVGRQREWAGEWRMVAD